MPTDGDPIREGGGRQITLEAVHSTVVVVVVAVVAVVGTVVEAPQRGAICQWEMFQCNTHTHTHRARRGARPRTPAWRARWAVGDGDGEQRIK